MRSVGQSAEPARPSGGSELPPTQGDITPPRVVKQARPKYPRDAFDRKIEGEVVIEFMIDTKGRVKNARVIKSVPGLDKAAIDCLKKWRFKPAVKNGKPIAAIAHAPVVFKIFKEGTAPSNKELRLTKPGTIGASQPNSSVRPTELWL